MTTLSLDAIQDYINKVFAENDDDGSGYLSYDECKSFV